MAFWQVTVPATPETTDALTNFLWEQGALGVVEEEMPPDPARLRAFFPESTSSTALVRAVRDYCASLHALGVAATAPEPEIAPLHDAAWASAWQQSFPPRAVGERLLVTPPWETGVAADGRLVLVIEPGRAFGTGHHGSTEGCLVLVERAIAARPAPDRVLDVGTGSGILAVAAIALGAARVVAIDIDPDATAAARANAARNDCADRIEIALAEPGEVDGTFPLVVANLLTHAHVALAGAYARLVAPGGALVLGGILADEDEVPARAVEPVGFARRDRVVIEGWSSLAFERRPA